MLKRERHFKSKETNQGVNFNNLQTLPSRIPTVQLTQKRPTTPYITCTPKIQNLIKIKSEQKSVIKGHTNLKIYCINPRSVKNKTLSFCDYIILNDLNLVAVTETWLGSSIDKACTSDLLPSGYQFKHLPRSWGRRFGDVALIFKASIDLRIVASSHENDFSSFEYMDCNVVISDYSLCIAVAYRPPPTQQNGLKTSVFLEQEWPEVWLNMQK